MQYKLSLLHSFLLSKESHAYSGQSNIINYSITDPRHDREDSANRGWLDLASGTDRVGSTSLPLANRRDWKALKLYLFDVDSSTKTALGRFLFSLPKPAITGARGPIANFVRDDDRRQFPRYNAVGAMYNGLTNCFVLPPEEFTGSRNVTLAPAGLDINQATESDIELFLKASIDRLLQPAFMAFSIKAEEI